MTMDESHRPMTMNQVLHQDVFWCPQGGAIIRLEDMSFRHLSNVQRWLSQYAPQLHATQLGLLHGMGEREAAPYEAILRVEQQDPYQWLRETPFMVKVAALLGDTARAEKIATEEAAVSDHECKACNAQPGESCFALTGTLRAIAHPHRVRVETARRAARERDKLIGGGDR